MATSVVEDLPSKIKDTSLKRSHQQGVIRGYINRIYPLVNSDQFCEVIPCEAQLVKLLAAREVYASLHHELLILYEKANEDNVAVQKKADALYLEIKKVYEDAQSWIADMKARDARGEFDDEDLDDVNSEASVTITERPTHEDSRQLESPAGFFTPGQMQPSMIGRRSEEKVTGPLLDRDDYETALKNKETEVNDMARRMAELQMKMDSMQNAQFHTSIIEEQMKKQSEDYQTRLRSQAEESRRLRDELSQSKARETAARTSTPGVHDYQFPRQPAPRADHTVNRSTLDQDDIFAISQVVSGANASMMKQMLDHTNRQQESFYSSMNVPETPLQRFDGDPTKFYMFMKRFDEVVHTSRKNTASKLNTLIEHCEENVRAHLDCCQYSDAETGYTLARSLLQKRFGNPFLVAQAWVDKLMKYPQLTSAVVMNKFVGELTSAYQTLGMLDYLSELECTKSMQMLVAKLPTHVQNRWRRVHREQFDKGVPAKLKQLIDVDRDASHEMNDPVYGPDCIEKITSSVSGVKGSSVRKKASINMIDPGVGASRASGKTSGAANVRLAKFPCKVCDDKRHYTYQCYIYKDYTPAERLAFVDKHHLCFLCLNDGHMVSACDRTYVCQYPGCGSRHNTTLHRALLQRRSDRSESVNHAVLEDDGEDLLDESEKEPEGLPVLCHENIPVFNSHRYHGNFVLPTLPVICETVHGGTTSNALIDTGSTVSMCSLELQKALGARPIARSEFLLQGINGNQVLMADVIEFSIQGTDSDDPQEVFNVIVNPALHLSHKHARQLRQYKEWPHLSHLNIVAADHNTVEILLGQDNARLFKSLECVDAVDQFAPYGVLTPLGWTIFGNLTDKISRYRQGCDTIQLSECMQTDNTHELISKMWEVDSVPEAILMSPVNRQIIDMWNKEFVMIEGHVHLPLPFKNDPPGFPDNRRPVLAQLNAMKKKFVQNPDLHRQYSASMQTNLDRGYMEPVTKKPRPGYENFVPQHAVITDRRPGKCRIVGNASFVFQNISLNKALHQGPNLTGDLVTIMIAFRIHPVVVTGDIEQMYNQVRVPECQRDALKVLWWPDGDYDQEVVEYQMTTQMFGLISSPAAAIHAMQEGVRRYSDDINPDTVEAALKCFYVDDLIKSVINVGIGIRLIRELRCLLSRIGFNLTKFGSNRLEILETLEEKDRAKPYQELEFALSEETTDKTLGSGWGPLKDVFIFVINITERPETRRGVLSTFSSVFDPLGLVGPVILKAKMLIQQICRQGFEWDQSLSDDIIESWRRWREDLELLSGFSVPRWLRVEVEKKQTYQIHVFADASESGYGAVAYLSVTDVEEQDVVSHMIMSKARVAPMKQLSIPRLELSAAVLAVKLARIIERGVQIPLTATVFWSDSTITLHCIQSQSRVFKTFVANRVSYIQEHTDTDQWRFVNGEQNIADVVSRGCSSAELRENDEWIRGPKFLRDPNEWPSMPDVLNRENIEGIPEYRATAVICHMTMKKDHLIQDRSNLMDDLVAHYSSWKKLVKAVGYWKKFFVYLKSPKTFKPGFTAVEYKRVEETIVRHAQLEFHTLTRSQEASFRRLYTFEDDGIIRVGGRLMMANLEYEERYPAVLPPGRIAKLYIQHKHSRLGHPGIDRTYMETRKRMWILSGKKFVKSSLSGCVLCQRMRSRVAEQMMAPLPGYRVDATSAPFRRIGVDFFGPIYVKIGRATIKRYGCAISCLTSRAIHIEPVSDLSTSSFLHALQRFIARRGKPSLIVSDNGTNFVGAHRELKELMKKWNKGAVKAYLLDEGIEWQFNTPTASHHGGVWERQIRSIRTLMMALIKGQSLTDEALHTYLCMVEQIINSRPLTKVSEDPSDELPLTPQHFLTLHHAEGIPGRYSPADSLRRRWKQVQYLSDQYWRKWTDSYLKELQIRTKWQIPHDNFKVGDLALYVKQDCKRLEWPLALIQKVHAGLDGKVRSVTIKTRDGIYDRPITKLIRLEFDE